MLFYPNFHYYIKIKELIKPNKEVELNYLK